ncbi:Nucleolar protein 16 [Xenoophorus captivus]|uniref:Nucleolar protein 16 n=1 Tax=Xenoophorus captivus TaxID=1517983 RepID=A0ABV0RMX8_9TELE
MPKAKQSKRRKRFDYNTDRKKLKKKFIKKAKPRIEHAQIRNAWDDNKSTARNLQEMGLSFDPNQTLPIKKQMEEASLQEKDSKTLSSDLIEYVQYMIREHKDNYKAMARDEKNYYQDTPKQIKRKINEYKRCHPQHYEAFISSLTAPEAMVQ